MDEGAAEISEVLGETSIDPLDNGGNNEFSCDFPATILEADVPLPSYPCNKTRTSPIPALLSGHRSYDPCNKDVRDSLAKPGVAGLRNLGNTCFMNSGMQCLLSNPSIIKFFLEDFKIDEGSRHVLAGKFAVLLEKFWSGFFSLLHPSEFHHTVGVYHSQFQDYRQHDCQEFLALLLDSLHEHLNVGCPQTKCNSSETEAEECVTGDGACVSGDGAMSMKDCLAGLESSDPSESGSDCCSGDECHLSCPPSKFNVCSPGDKSRKELMTLDCLNQLYGTSEDSNLSEPSRASTDSGASDRSHGVSRWAMIPEEIKAEAGVSKFFGEVSFNDLSTSAPEIVMSTDEETKRSGGGEETENEASVDANLSDRKLPSIEDFCNKDTKTLNTNVLATDYMQEIVSTDSTKFLKVDNNSRSSVAVQDEEMNAFEHLNDLLACDTEKELCKPVKDTNLLVNCHDKFSDGGSYGKKLLFSELEPGDEYNINNTKRIKVDEEEKNLRMQSKLKVNTEQNPTRDCETKSPGRRSFEDQSFSLMSSSANDDSLALQRTMNIGAVPCLNNEDHMRLKYICSAEKAWTRYTQENKSVVVDTFQGQFKSTVICLECHHISVTFEPFMYLSVPLPHALERQICVTFIPCDNKQPVCYLVTVMRHDHVKSIRQELTGLIGEESCDIILAEVLDNHIARILDNSLEVKSVNDTDRLIYAFEMLPAPRYDEFSAEQSPVGNALRADSDGNVSLANNVVPVMTKMIHAHCNSPADVDDLLEYFENSDANSGACPSAMDSDTAFGVESSTENLLNNSYETSSATCDSRIDTKPDVDWHHNLLELSAEAENSRGDLLGTDVWKSYPGTTSNVIWGESDVQAGPSCAGDAARFGQDSMDLQMSKLEGGGASAAVGVDDAFLSCDDAVAQNQWRTCAICLEEMVDNDLLVHPSCGGILCHSCLEVSYKHYEKSTFPCPICSTAVETTEGFVRLNNMADYKPRIRILSIPVMCRNDCANEETGCAVGKLFGHPNILYLPSKLSGVLLYETVDRVISCNVSYSIILTDGQGYHCSRCLYTQHCSGCEVKRDEQLNLQPSDHLVVKFTDLSESYIKDAGRYVEHISMKNRRSSDPLTLYDCFRAFTESELLDEHNPWFCPKCRKNQCAKKTMTVWRFPGTLVVYLKRFVYYELSSTKIDCKVKFPVDDLDLSNYASGPQRENLTYELQSCVCHFGGAHSGHYTAYAKHPVTSEWHYFNDETAVKQEPHEGDCSHAYVLFYQRKGSPVEFCMPQPSNFEDASNDAFNSGTLMAQEDPVEDDANANSNKPVSDASSAYQSNTGRCDFYQ